MFEFLGSEHGLLVTFLACVACSVLGTFLTWSTLQFRRASGTGTATVRTLGATLLVSVYPAGAVALVSLVLNVIRWAKHV